MTTENDMPQDVDAEAARAEQARVDSMSLLEKAHLTSQRCKAFMQVVRATNRELRDNPEAQREQARKLW